MRFRPKSTVTVLVLLVLAAAGGGTLVLLDRNPVHLGWLDRDDPEAPSTDAFRETASPVLLVTSTEGLCAAARPLDFDRMDWSLAWINLLDQEIGRFAHIELRRLAGTSWQDRAVVILGHSAVDRLPDAARDALVAWIKAGGVLVLDRPGGTWKTTSGVELAPGRFEEGKITDADPEVLSPAVRAELDAASLPLPVFQQPPAAAPANDVRTLLAINDRPAIVSRPLGRGAVVTLTFDLGRLLVMLQQGAATASDYTVRKRWGFYDYLLESHDLVWHEAYLKNPIPAADVMERAVLAAVRKHRSLPAWWAFPDEAEGILLMTHDEDLYGSSQCRLLLDHEKAIAAKATYFLITARRVNDTWPPAAVKAFIEAGADLQLHWNRLPMVTGVWKLEPFSRVFSLTEQVDAFREAMAAGGAAPGPLLNRNHYLMWASGDEFGEDAMHYTRAFRVMHRHGIVMDSTYGPNRGGRGYLFGTGRPFYPMDVDGKRIPVLEMPFVSQENWGGEDAAWFERLFADSRRFYHTAVCCIFHPHIIVREEAGNRLWKSVYESASRHGHKALTFREYHDFLAARRSSPLAHRQLPSGGVRIEAEAVADGLSVMVKGAPRRVQLDGRTVTRSQRISLDGLPFTLVPVPRGKHTLVVTP